MRHEYGSDRRVVCKTMWWVAGVCLSRRAWVLVLVALCTAACGNNPPAPSITFTRIPPAAKGGPDVLDTIEGRVTGARRDQRLVIYSRNSVWWGLPGPGAFSIDARLLGRREIFIPANHGHCTG